MKTVAAAAILLLLVPQVSAADARLEGLVIGVDGRPATGHSVHLIDGEGRSSQQAAVSDDGLYSLKNLEAGRYDLALQTPDGRFAPVGAAPVDVREGQLARRDLKLIERDPSQPAPPVSANFGTWWAGLDWGAKAWTVAAVVVLVGVTIEALDENESPASQFGT